MLRQFSLFQGYQDRIQHGVTTVSWGSFQEDGHDLDANLLKLQRTLAMERPVMLHQVHSDRILTVKRPFSDLPEGDALMTITPGLPLMVRVADCQGLMIYDPRVHCMAVVHSGWRGSTLNIIGKTVRQLQETYGSEPHDLLVAISPSLGPCCASFSDPFRELPACYHKFIVTENCVDFWALSLWQCLAAGIPGEQVELAQECSKCQPEYFSHRNGDAGRMAVFLNLL